MPPLVNRTKLVFPYLSLSTVNTPDNSTPTLAKEDNINTPQWSNVSPPNTSPQTESTNLSDITDSQGNRKGKYNAQIKDLTMSLETANATIKNMQKQQEATEKTLEAINDKLAQLLAVPSQTKNNLKCDRQSFKHTPSSDMNTPVYTKKQAGELTELEDNSDMEYDVPKEPVFAGGT